MHLVSHGPPSPFSSSYLVPCTLLSESPPLCHSPFLPATYRRTKSYEKSLRPAQSHTEGKTNQELISITLFFSTFSLQQKKKRQRQEFSKTWRESILIQEEHGVGGVAWNRPGHKIYQNSNHSSTVAVTTGCTLECPGLTQGGAWASVLFRSFWGGSHEQPRFQTICWSGETVCRK